jgi:hypothetical protein
MDEAKRWLIKMVALFSLLSGDSDFSKMARQSLWGKTKAKAKQALEFSKKALP